MAQIAVMSEMKDTTFESSESDDSLQDSVKSNKRSNENKESMTDLSLVSKLDKESSTLDKLVKLSLLEVDYKTGYELNNPNNKWKVSKSRDKTVKIIYRKMGDNDVISLRSCMDIKCDSINDIYDYLDCEYNDDIALAFKYDKMMSSYNINKIYDNNRCLIHATFTTGIAKSIIKPRDFCYIKKRFKYDNYNGQKMVGIIGYSVDSTNPDFVEREHKHIRGWMHYFGVIFIPKSDNTWTVNYIVCLDPCGKLPKSIINICAPQQGMNIKKLASQLDEIKTIVNDRREKMAKKANKQ